MYHIVVMLIVFINRVGKLFISTIIWNGERTGAGVRIFWLDLRQNPPVDINEEKTVLYGLVDSLLEF